jgi:hypothetical protein
MLYVEYLGRYIQAKEEEGISEQGDGSSGILGVPAHLWMSVSQPKQELANCEKFIMKFFQINLHHSQAVTAILCKKFGCSTF